MNCKPVLVIAVCICLLLGSGMLGYGGEFRINGHGGINMPSIHGEEGDPLTEGFESRQGLFFGIGADLGLAPHFSLGAEINYCSQGGVRGGLQIITPTLLPEGLPFPSDMALYASFNNESILDYIEIPLLARLAFGKKIQFFINAGPYIGFLVRAIAVTAGKSLLYLDKNGTMPIVIPPSTQPVNLDMTAETDIKDSLKDTNIGLTGGAGASVSLGPGRVVVEGRLQMGLTTIQRDIQKSGKSRTGGFVIAAGYSLPLAKKTSN
ncbi:MAG: PorT family protein [Candidatus Aminicenantes bacterium]|nr:PorT family protein [Candidatus Aminicenantes bacterium]